jgi:hypothetical protein
VYCIFFDINIKKLLHSNMQILDQLQKKKKQPEILTTEIKLALMGRL